VLAAVGPAQGQGLLNKTYVRFDAGYLTYGDEILKEADAWSVSGSATANLAVIDYLDVFAWYTLSSFLGDPPGTPFHPQLSGMAFDELTHTIGLGVLGHAAPEDQIDLFVSASAAGAEQTTDDDSLNPFTIVVTAGTEFRSSSPLSVRAYISYISIDPDVGGNRDLDRINDGQLGFDASYWLYSHLFLGLSSNVTFEDKNAGISAGVGLSL
jgi:hypothetical protein